MIIVQFIGSLNSSDPYVIIYCGDEMQKSKIIDNNLNPRWNQSFQFSWDSLSKLHIQVMDANRFRADGIGFEFVNLIMITSNNRHNLLLLLKCSAPWRLLYRFSSTDY